MREHAILFTGPAGAGVSTAIRSISHVELAEDAGDGGRPGGEAGEILLGEDERVRLLAVPAHERRDLAARIHAERAIGLLLLVDNSRPDPIGHALPYLGEAGPLLASGGVVVGVTHLDGAADPSVDDYSRAFRAARPDAEIPVLPLDPREPGDVRLALLSLVANRQLQSATE